jgi:RNA polymerase sigma factor (sigma-70 family)
MNDKEEQMILDNLGLIYISIKELCLSWETEDEWQDFYDSGLIGLINGVKTYDNNKGFKISTFLSCCIKNEIKHHLKIKTAKKRFNENGKTVSLNVLTGEDENTELAEYIKDKSINIEKQVEQKIEIEYILHRINKMKNKKDALVLKMYFGIDGFAEKNFREISDVLKVSQQRIRERFYRGLENLKETIERDINGSIQK